jgi:hypothetical protein
MSNPRYQLLSQAMLGLSLVMLLLGLYFVFRMGNVMVGGALIVVAVVDVGVAVAFSKQSR